MQADGTASAKALGWNQRGRSGGGKKGHVTGCQGGSEEQQEQRREAEPGSGQILEFIQNVVGSHRRFLIFLLLFLFLIDFI